YASLFGGEIVYMLTYAQSPLAESVPPDWRDKVWFARLRAGGLEITGGDPGFPDYEAPRGFSMVLGVAKADGGHLVFARRAGGGGRGAHEVAGNALVTTLRGRLRSVRDPMGNQLRRCTCSVGPGARDLGLGSPGSGLGIRGHGVRARNSGALVRLDCHVCGST